MLRPDATDDGVFQGIGFTAHQMRMTWALRQRVPRVHRSSQLVLSGIQISNTTSKVSKDFLRVRESRLRGVEWWVGIRVVLTYEIVIVMALWLSRIGDRSHHKRRRGGWEEGERGRDSRLLGGKQSRVSQKQLVWAKVNVEYRVVERDDKAEGVASGSGKKNCDHHEPSSTPPQSYPHPVEPVLTALTNKIKI